MRKMVTKLLHYLNADTVAYHARVVHLICSLETSTAEKHVESVIAQTMASPESRNVAEAYEAFGVLWRLSGKLLFIPFVAFLIVVISSQRTAWFLGTGSECQ